MEAAPSSRPMASTWSRPVYDEETILYADLDLRRIAEEQMTLDVTGGYARDDVFAFAVNRQRQD